MDVVQTSMKLVNIFLDGTPPMLDGALVAIHVHLVVVLGELALVELRLDSRPTGEARLIATSDRAASHRHPRFHQALVLLGNPTNAMVLGVLCLHGFTVDTGFNVGFTVGMGFTYLAVLISFFIIVIVLLLPVVFSFMWALSMIMVCMMSFPYAQKMQCGHSLEVENNTGDCPYLAASEKVGRRSVDHVGCARAEQQEGGLSLVADADCVG